VSSSSRGLSAGGGGGGRGNTIAVSLVGGKIQHSLQVMHDKKDILAAVIFTFSHLERELEVELNHLHYHSQMLPPDGLDGVTAEARRKKSMSVR
jgi:anthranilate/para-aminobenzoate synthase component II